MLSKTGKGVLASLIVLLICSVWIVATAAEPPALARLSGAEKAKLAKLIEGAKKEGEVVAYSFSPVKLTQYRLPIGQAVSL